MKHDEWWEVATHFRRGRFYLRFFGPAYRNTPGLRDRARKWAPGWTVWLAETLGPPGRWLLLRLLDLLEQSTRTAAHLHQFLRERNPDLVVVTPLVVFKTKRRSSTWPARPWNSAFAMFLRSPAGTICRAKAC